MIVVGKDGRIFSTRFELRADLSASDGKTSSQPVGRGRVLCPRCGKLIARVMATTRGRDINGYCPRCKKNYWFDVID